ncbi:hypothetical protein M514_17098 [Trichuris suis]|uniref:RRM domain-containing protein n=1 Tax=Trichuris suis TaxID=68888 RepID=A0A085NMD0_9BILA|nr:hypothetical protein M514_17098 [Trichuris suis]
MLQQPSAKEQIGRNESIANEAMEAPQNQIFVGNLPEDIKEIELKDCFKAYGKVTNVIVRSKRILHMGRDGGLAVYAFIAFAEKESVTRVLNDSQNVLVRGHTRVNIQLRRSPQPARLRYLEARNDYRDGRNTGELELVDMVKLLTVRMFEMVRLVINDVASDQVDLSKQDEKTMATDAFCKTEEVVVTAPAAAEQNGTEADKSIPSEGVENSVPKEDNCEEQTTWATIVKTPSEKQETDSRLKTTAECRTMQKNLVS